MYHRKRFAVGVLCFVDICSDTGSGSTDLIGDDRFSLFFQIFDKVNISTANATERSTSLFGFSIGITDYPNSHF